MLKKVCLGLMIVAIVGGSALAVPKMINVQGRLTEPLTGATKVPPNDTQIIFKIYEGGDELHPGNSVYGTTLTAGQNIFIDDNGVFNVSLINIAEEFLSDTYYMGIKVGNDNEMRPLQRLVSIPFAITARNLRGGTIVTESSATGVYSVSTTSNSGMYGESKSGSGVEGKGFVGVRGWGYDKGGDFESQIGYGVYSTAPKNYFSGNVGIGTTGPSDKLEISSNDVNVDSVAIRFESSDRTSGGTTLYDSMKLVGGWHDTGSIAWGENRLSIVGQSAANVWSTVATFKASGNVGIGTTEPNAKLHVESASVDGKSIYGKATASKGVGVYGSATTNDGVGIYGWAETGLAGSFYGDVLITKKLTVKGIPGLPSVGSGYLKYSAGDGSIWYLTSSKRYKDNILPFEGDFNKILQAQPKSFVDKVSREKDIGYIAEEFDELGLNNLVVYNKDGLPDSIQYDKISLYMLEVMKDQQKAIKDQQAQIDKLKLELAELRKLGTKH